MDDAEYENAPTEIIATPIPPRPQKRRQLPHDQSFDLPPTETIPNRRMSSDELYATLGKRRQKIESDERKTDNQNETKPKVVMFPQNGLSVKPAEKDQELGTLF